jgi:hypothetical protein
VTGLANSRLFHLQVTIHLEILICITGLETIILQVRVRARFMGRGVSRGAQVRALGKLFLAL